MDNEQLSRDDDLIVTIPVEWLLILAVHGHMGTGEIPNIMKQWARNKLSKNGYKEVYMQCQKEKIRQLTQNLSNVIGKDGANDCLNAIAFAQDVINEGLNTLKKEEI